MTVKAPPPAPLCEELEKLLRRLRLPYVRRLAPEVLATAKAQRSGPQEVLRVLWLRRHRGATERRSRSAAGPQAFPGARRSMPGRRRPARSPKPSSRR